MDLGFRARTRFHGFFEERRLYQYQATAGVPIGDGARLTVGYEHFRSREQSLEHRYFPQLDLRSRWLGVDLRHRLRAEIRDIDAVDKTIYRLRYRLSHTRPLGTRGAYLTLGDEIFYAASAIDNLLEQGFTQNRIGGAVGMRIGSSARLELGYQWAYVDSGFVSRGDHLIQFNLIWDAR